MISKGNKFYRTSALKQFKENNNKGIISFIFFILFSLWILLFKADDFLYIKWGLLIVTIIWILLYKRIIDVKIQNLKEKYYPNGQIRQTEDGMRITGSSGSSSSWNLKTTKYYENGNIKSKTEEENGKTLFYKEWDKDGKLINSN